MVQLTKYCSYANLFFLNKLNLKKKFIIKLKYIRILFNDKKKELSKSFFCYLFSLLFYSGFLVSLFLLIKKSKKKYAHKQLLNSFYFYNKFFFKKVF